MPLPWMKSRILIRILNTRLAGDFDAGGDIDGIRPRDANRFGDIVGVEAAGEDDGRQPVEFAGFACFGDPVPVEGLARAAELRRGGGVEEDSPRAVSFDAYQYGKIYDGLSSGNWSNEPIGEPIVAINDTQFRLAINLVPIDSKLIGHFSRC